MHALEAIGPIDGRYRRHTEPLAEHFSEQALIKKRVLLEAEYFIALAGCDGVPMRKLAPHEHAAIMSLPTNLSLADCEIIKQIETKGWNSIKKTDHDVKAVELWMRHVLAQNSLNDLLEWLHFALTSEDINNLSYAMMLTGGIRTLLPKLEDVLGFLDSWAQLHAADAMMARTHGQPATPTTFGKEMRIFAERLHRQIEQLRTFRLLVKLNGASGNYNAHFIALPNVDWVDFSRKFIEHIGHEYSCRFDVNLHTTQIEPHDNYAELSHLLARINTILIDFCQDMWQYVSDKWIVLLPEEGAAGSSTMPNKINPIQLENAEGNAQVANSMFEGYARTLPISRRQRHLSDSTIIRTFGVAFGHTLVAYRMVLTGLGRMRPDVLRMKQVLSRHPEVVAEAYQTILRRHGYPDPYEALKKLTRGVKVTLEDLQRFTYELDVNDEVRAELLAVDPLRYLGLSRLLAETKPA